MYRLKLATFADNVIIDQSTNSVSIIGIIEDIRSVTLPFVLPRFCIFMLLHKDPEDPNIQQGHVRLLSNGTVLHTFPVELNFQGMKNLRHTLMFGGYLVQHPGTLGAVLDIGEQQISLYEIEIAGLNAPQVEGSH